jgi:cytidine deaminase
MRGRSVLDLAIAKRPPPPAPSAKTRRRARLRKPESELFEAAKEASARSDPAWSKFRVGAALRSAGTDVIYTGGNFENDSYSLTICAERAAIARAISVEGPELRVLAIAVYGEKGVRPVKPAATPSPCGACRQVIWQYGPLWGVDTTVIFPVRGVPQAFRMVDLLPEPFELV